MTQSRTEAARNQALALVETLKRVRAEVSKHVDVGEGAPAVPRHVYFVVQDIVEAIDATIEGLMSDEERDEDIDDAIEDINRR